LLDFRTPTRKFDDVWYGYKVDGSADVALFREYYERVLEGLRAERLA
jgi:hypothetical protein